MTAKSRKPATSGKVAATARPDGPTPGRDVPAKSGVVPSEPSATPIFDALVAELGDPLAPGQSTAGGAS